MSKLTLPSLLSYTRSLQPSIAEFFYLREAREYPITIEEVTVRGSISDYKSGTGENLKNIDKPNIQTIEVAQLPIDVDTFKLRFSLTVLAHALRPNACNEPQFQQQLISFIENYAAKKGLHFLAERYVENIINGRWLWRNRYAKDLIIQINYAGQQHSFKCASRHTLAGEDLAFFNQLIEAVATALSGASHCLNIKVTATGVIGHGQEVFPSQEFTEKKTGKPGEKSKVLAKVTLEGKGKVAILHSQKIGNALRTIDTWYAKDAEDYPLAIEPYGIDQASQQAKRPPKAKTDLYSYLQQLDRLTTELEQAETIADIDPKAHFVAACLIRGGVYSGFKDKKEKKVEG